MEQWVAIDKVLAAAISCPEVHAVFLKGSLAYGTADEYSDVDFYCLVEEGDIDTFLPKRVQLLESYRPLLYTSMANFVGPQVVAVYDTGLHFDLYTVTVEHFPLIGSFKVLYDPENILAPLALVVKEHRSRAENVAAAFSEFSFTLLEFLAAFRRRDLVWSYRLASHLVGDLGLVLRFRFDPTNALLGLKRLESNIPQPLRDDLRKAVDSCHGDNLPRGVLGLCTIMEFVTRDLEQEHKLCLAWGLFNKMQAEVRALIHESN